MADQSKNNIDKALEALNLGLDIESGNGVEVELEKEVEFDPAFEIQEDGSAIIPEDMSEQTPTEHTSNLADFLPETDLNLLSSDLVNLYESDKDSRKDWEDTYVKGLDMLGFKYENRTQPFEGASGVVHPLLAESVTQFQAQAYKELLPASGPVNCQIIGEITPEIEDQSARVKEFMNYELMNVMKEYDPDMDQLLFYLPLSGSAFKKVYYDGQLERAVAKFVSGEDLVVDYFATDIETAQRITHCIKMSGNDLRKNQVSGFYSDVEVKSGEVDPSEVREKINELEGNSPSYGTDNEEHLLLEMHVDLDLPGFEDPSGIKLPYIVTIDKYSQEILSIKRNWDEEDKKRNKKQYFVHFKFLPGLGFYGFGLIHMLGGLSRTATSVLRQLIDAGTLANLPAGFKARGMRIRDNDEPIQPGEFRDVDVSGASIRESLLPLPFKEPSATLFQLLGFAVDAGKSFSAIADMKMGEGNEQNPVGTTLAILERGTKVMSAIHKRMHYAQKVEFKLLSKVFQQYLPPEYPYNVVGGNRMIKQQDFDDRVDIMPVSDPNIFSMSQRIQLAQAQLQLTGANPGIHNIYEAYRRMYQALGVNNIDAVLPPPPKPGPVDPAKENSEALKSKPLTAYPEQNHEAHIKAHRAFMSSSLVRQSVIAMASLQAHISEHISFMARQQVMEKNKEELEQLQQQLGGQQLPPEMQKEMQNRLESEIAEVESTITEEIVAEEQEYLEGTGQDPLVELKTREIDIKEQDAQRKAMYDMEKLDIDRGKLDQKTEIDQKKLDQDAEIAAMRAGINLKQAKMRKN